ncbi:PAS domain-containing protein [Falsiroseomonas sp. CW058]|uniref:PAS domain-containing protein n=1 Tax=Falsiroseomonas sp. CW058 TaxID=3388664 RepID=UPI003D318B98
MTVVSPEPMRVPNGLPALLLTPALAACVPADAGAAGWWAALPAAALAAALAPMAWRGWRLGRAWPDHAARQARLLAAQAELKGVAERAEAKARLLDGVLAAMADGVMVMDGDLRLVGWNPRFPDFAGVPRQLLRIGMPMAELLRLQAEAGEFGLVDPEAEVARRLDALRKGAVLQRIERERPDGSRIELRRAPLPGGGFVTLYTPVLDRAAPPDKELGEQFRAEWSARIPRLTAAAADGDAPSARAAAHALRGIAANAGWPGAAATLGAIEAAAEAGDLREVRALASLLALDPPW